ncbi:MAG: cyclic nucleotide-binding protein [Candidatus Marinimicrobia bacterium]|nr:cyclic nucleotide-binding protein [Candidatus Neomarinimicrobiota bacterium]
MRKVLYILGQLDDEDVNWLADVGQRRKVQPGEVLIEERKAGVEVLIVLEGSLSVSVLALGELARLGAGEIVGEMSLIDSRPASASVTAVEPSTVLAIPKDVIQIKLNEDIGFAARFYRAVAVFLSGRMRGTVQKLGYGSDSTDELDEEVEAEGELDLDVLDKVHLAGARFDRMLKRLLGTD